MSTMKKNGAKVSKMAKLQNQIKNLLTQQAQDHGHLIGETIDSVAPHMAQPTAAMTTMPSAKQPTAKAQEPVKKVYPRFIETGHAINISNFNKLIQAVTGYGSSYVTPNLLLALASLQTLYTAAFASLGNVIDKLVVYDASIDEQKTAFQGLKQLCTRVFNTYKACGTSTTACDHARTFNYKIQGARAVKINPGEEDANHISPSQQSHAQLIQHFDGLIKILEADPLYNPGTPELTTVSLRAKWTAIYNAYQNVATATMDLKNARLERNLIMYTPTTGLVDIAFAVKQTTIGIFGARSPQYRQISSLMFRRILEYKYLLPPS